MNRMSPLIKNSNNKSLCGFNSYHLQFNDSIYIHTYTYVFECIDEPCILSLKITHTPKRVLSNYILCVLTAKIRNC